MRMEINDDKYLIWEEIVKKYKDVWVFLKDYKIVGSVIDGGVVFCITSDDIAFKTGIELRKKGIDFYYAPTYNVDEAIDEMMW